MSLVNECAFRAASGGTGNFVVASAITGFFVPADLTTPAIVDGGTYSYRAESDDGTQHESGLGTWSSGTSTLARTTVYQSSNGGAKVNFSAAPIVQLMAAAQDCPGGFEIVTTGASPKTINTQVDRTYVITGGTGGTEELDFPSGSGGVTTDYGRFHTVILVTLTNPADTLRIGGIVDIGHTFSPPSAGSYGVYRSTSNGYQTFDGAGLTFDSLPDGVLTRQPSGSSIFGIDPALQFSETITTSGSSGRTTNGSTLNSLINSSGSGGEEDLAVHAADFQIGQRKLIVFNTEANPADFIFISSANIRYSGAAPSLVQLNASGDQLLLEWTVDSATNAHFWNVLQFSTGVVTP